MKCKILYITYISMNKRPTSGSSVRPQKMKEAFESLDVEVKTYDGMNNDLNARRKTVSEIKKLLRTWNPDVCYIEPPSGPMFYWGDIGLIKLIHKKGIPSAIFYRDAYWRYPEYFITKETPIKERFKQFIIKLLQLYQWKVFTGNIDIIYFTSQTVAHDFICPHKALMPPGSFIPEIREKTVISNPVQFIFVGGADKNHGTFLTIDAFEKVNRNEMKAKLYYICPENQWRGLGINQEKYKDWLEVVHTSGDEQLKKYYEKADVAVLTAPRTEYRDLAVPIKIFEYISYLKPMLVTNCTETAKIVNDNQIGWVVEDNVDDVAEKIKDIILHPDDIMVKKEKMEVVRENNLWVSRARKILNELSEIT